MNYVKKEIAIPNYSLTEEIVNAITHGIGAGFSIWIFVIAIIKATKHSVLSVVSVSIYGTTVVMLYSMSCIYHALSKNLKGKKFLEYLIIAMYI